MVTHHPDYKHNWRIHTDAGTSQLENAYFNIGNKRTSLPPAPLVKENPMGELNEWSGILEISTLETPPFKEPSTTNGLARRLLLPSYSPTDETVISIYSTLAIVLQIYNEWIKIAAIIISATDIYRTVLVWVLRCRTIHRGGSIATVVLYTANENVSTFVLSRSNWEVLVLNLMPCQHSRSKRGNCGK